VAIHTRIAALFEHVGDLESALDRLQTAHKLLPKEPQPLRRIAALLELKGNHEQAAEHLRQLLEILQTPSERLAVHRRLAALYLGELDDLRSAAEHIERGLTLDQLDPDCIALQLELTERAGSREQILAALQQALEVGALRRGELLLRRGRLLAEDGDIESALDTLTEATSENDDVAWQAWKEMALLHERRGELPQAAACWEQTLASSAGAKESECWIRQARVLLALSQPEAARDALTAARRLQPDDPRELLEHLARVHAQLDDPQSQLQALLDLARVAEERQDLERLQHTLVQLAELRMQLGYAEQALQTLRRLVDAFPDQTSSWERLGLAQAESGYHTRARDALERAVSLSAKDANEQRRRLFEKLAELAAEQSSLRAAIDDYHRALGEQPAEADRDRFWEGIVRLHLRRGDPVAAAEAKEQSVDPRSGTQPVDPRSGSGAGVCTSWRYASLESDEPLQAIVAEQNTVHVLQGRGNYSRKSSGSFSALSTGSNSYYGWLSFDAQDTPNIAFAQNGSGYHDAYENGAFTRNKLPFTFVNSLRLPMVFDSQNTRYALFSTRSYLSSSHTWITKGKLDLGITDSNTGTSRRETIINLVSGSTAKTAEPMNLALDSSGHVHALWTNSTDNDVHYATNASGTWVDRRVTTAFSGIRSFFLADGTPYLCWKVNSDLFVGQVNQAPFKPEKLPISLSGGTSAIDCTANHAQRPAMLVGNTLLQKQADGSWTSETFPTFSDPLQVRVSFDTNGSPHVVYSMDVAGTFVRYASRP
jgi:tetratricopeptide (TPR) repeat protein